MVLDVIKYIIVNELFLKHEQLLLTRMVSLFKFYNLNVQKLRLYSLEKKWIITTKVTTNKGFSSCFISVL